MAIKKVEYDGHVLIDLSTDTVTTADDIALGKVGHLNNGTVVTGTHSGGGSSQVKSVTPTLESQTVLPDIGYNNLSQVTVAAIPITYTDNVAGGKTVTIG